MGLILLWDPDCFLFDRRALETIVSLYDDANTVYIHVGLSECEPRKPKVGNAKDVLEQQRVDHQNQD